MYDVLADDPSGDFLGELCCGRPQHGVHNTITAHRVLIPKDSLIGKDAQMSYDNSYYLWISADVSPQRAFEARTLETKGVLALRYRQPRPLLPPVGGLLAPNILQYRPRVVSAPEHDVIRPAMASGPQIAGLRPARLTRE